MINFNSVGADGLITESGCATSNIVVRNCSEAIAVLASRLCHQASEPLAKLVAEATEQSDIEHTRLCVGCHKYFARLAMASAGWVAEKQRDPYVQESVQSAFALAHDALCAALDNLGVWQRGLKLKIRQNQIEIALWATFATWLWERGLNFDVFTALCDEEKSRNL